MKKLLLTLTVCSSIMTTYAQQIGGDFDNFETGYNSVGVQPFGWKGSNVKQQVIIPVSKQMIYEDNGRTNKSVKMVNAFVGVFTIGSNAPAYITLGNPWVYATTDINEADGGTYGGINFSYRPDALKGYIKRQLGSEKNEVAQIFVYSWKGTTSINKTVSSSDGKNTSTDLIDRDREVLSSILGTTEEGASKSEDFELVSYGKYEVPKDQNISDWSEVLIPIDYKSNSIPEKLNVIISSADYFNRGNIGKDNTLWTDDFEFIYYSELASLSYDGVNYFQKGVTNYTVNAGYDESKLSCTSNGKGATIEKSYNEETAVLTITVKGNDVSVNPSNVHTYTVQFNKPVVTTYANSLLVNVFGTYVEPTENSIDLIKEADNSYSLQLKNFAFGDMSLGDIKIVNLNREEKNDAVIYSAENQMVYVGGFINTELPITLSATQKGDELTADIHIAVAPGANVDVTFLPALTINGEDKVSASADRYNVTMNRTFTPGWSTICLPFATTPAALGAASVQELVSADDNGLNFAEVETVEANKPYLVYFDAAKDVPTYFPAEIASTTPVAVTKGDYTFVGSYAASISMNGKYGIATIDDAQKLIMGGDNSTLKATRAYFTKAGEQPTQVRINLYTNGTTGIDQIEKNGAQVYDVYSLQGVQVLKGATSLDGLKKGIYIVNGKKMVIK